MLKQFSNIAAIAAIAAIGENITAPITAPKPPKITKRDTGTSQNAAIIAKMRRYCGDNSASPHPQKPQTTRGNNPKCGDCGDNPLPWPIARAYTHRELTIGKIAASPHFPARSRSQLGHELSRAELDGLVDAGWLSDDDALHVIGPDMRIGEKTGISGIYRIRFTITPTNAPKRDRNDAVEELPTGEIQTQPSPGSAKIPGITGDDRR